MAGGIVGGWLCLSFRKLPWPKHMHATDFVAIFSFLPFYFLGSQSRDEKRVQIEY